MKEGGEMKLTKHEGKKRGEEKKREGHSQQFKDDSIHKN